MAYQASNGTSIPHATSATDLLAKLITYATATVPSGIRWTAVENVAGDHVILRGPGGGSDQIFVGILNYSNVVDDRFGWVLQGYTGYNSGVSFHDQPGAIPSLRPMVPLWNSEIPFEFFVSGRRIMCLAQVSSVFIAFYLGWAKIYGSNGQWAYPLCVGGSAISTTDTPPRYSTTGADMTHFTIPVNNGNGVSSLRILNSAGVWEAPMILATSSGTAMQGAGVWPFSCSVHDTLGGGLNNIKPGLGGKYPLLPMMIHTTTNIFGEFEGVKQVTGDGNSPGSSVTEGSDVYSVTQNVYRNDRGSFWAALRA